MDAVKEPAEPPEKKKGDKKNEMKGATTGTRPRYLTWSRP